MEILASLFAFPAEFAGVLILAVIAHTTRSRVERPYWARFLRRGSLYAILLSFLFLSYAFALSAALSTSYIYFILFFTALFGCTSFLLPWCILKWFGQGNRWFARSVAAFGYAIVLLTFSTLLVRKLSLSATIPRPAILLFALISLSIFALPRLIRTGSTNVGKVD